MPKALQPFLEGPAGDDLEHAAPYAEDGRVSTVVYMLVGSHGRRRESLRPHVGFAKNFRAMRERGLSADLHSGCSPRRRGLPVADCRLPKWHRPLSFVIPAKAGDPRQASSRRLSRTRARVFQQGSASRKYQMQPQTRGLRPSAGCGRLPWIPSAGSGSRCRDRRRATVLFCQVRST